MKGSEFMKVELQMQGDIAAVRVNNAPSGIFDLGLMAELSSVLDQIPGAPLLVLSFALQTSDVDKRFLTAARAGQLVRAFHGIIRKIYHHDGVTVTLLNGNTLGGGMELALVCDFIFARSGSRLGFVEIKTGSLPPVASILLPRKIGAKGYDFLDAGAILDATAAEELGVIEAVFSDGPEELLDTVRQHSFYAMKMLKKILRHRAGFDFNATLAQAEELYLRELIQTHDFGAELIHLLEKREPRFSNWRDGKKKNGGPGRPAKHRF
jgi:enoyl-CoA hydratase/carnithine racemase